MADRRPEAYITGIGVVTPIGVGRKKLWSSLLANESGAGPITLFDPEDRKPVFAYRQGSTKVTDCAITGGAFYNPTTRQFPSGYVGDYFFADYCSGWIRRLDDATGDVSAFATGLGSPVALKVSKGGSLYYLSRGAGTGSVGKIRHTAT
jgi:hypothetical protein